MSAPRQKADEERAIRTKKQGTLCLRRVAIDTYRENVAYLHRACKIYQAEGFQALSKVTVTANGNKVIAVLNVVDDTNIVNPGELGLSEQAYAQISCEEGNLVKVTHAEPANSMEAVRRKINGERLSREDFIAITQDISHHRYTKVEMTAFLVASGQTSLDRDEILYLTEAMTKTGKRLNWHEQLVVDKHCIGGIPGNRTSMLVVPIIAAHGMLIPKTSSRAITSPAGTADTMEVLANVDITPEHLHRIVNKERACLAWGGTANLAPVDDLLIAVERPLGIDSQGQLVASILSKKLAAGSTHLLIDIPVGPTAKVRTMNEALRLRKLFEFIGDQLGLHLEVMITDALQPIGRGIGPVLEARDVMQVLHNHPNAPHDLIQKSLTLAGRILEFHPDVRGGSGYAIARDILESGRALEKMQAIIEAQGKQARDFQPGKLSHVVNAERSGKIVAIDNYLMARIASRAGAPQNKGAGVDLMQKVGDQVSKGQPLYRVHAEFTAEMEFAKAICETQNGYQIHSDN